MLEARLPRVLARIDALNREDPNTELAEGTALPRELAYADRLTAWVLRLNPEAPEALRIAARGQHIRRWTIPRARYEPGRRGYLQWRETLKAFHIDTVSALMREEGYDEATVDRARFIMSKRQLNDPDAQTLEDALCLIFLETQFADLRGKTEPDKMRGILQKTWGKMSDQARAEALRLRLALEDREFLVGAVS